VAERTQSADHRHLPCATLAHRALGLDPPASCRLSFYLYNTVEEIDRAAGALAWIVGSGQNRTNSPEAGRPAVAWIG
jgi:selenocysteine lyase/cysteine desulfurase